MVMIPVRLNLEALEVRTLLSSNGTLIQAVPLGTLGPTTPLAVSGTIDNENSAGGVDWYRFRLADPSEVRLTATGTSTPVLSLYTPDPYNPADPATLLGSRQLEQEQGTAPGTATVLDRKLAAGTYDLAVSGAGNRYFSPVLADSGYPGATGDYRLSLTATDLGLAPADGPVVLASSPSAGSAVSASPLVLRLDLSTPLDPTTVALGDNVRLTWNATGAFGNGKDVDVPLDNFNFSETAVELQLSPAAPLASGYYQVRLGGNTAANDVALADPNGIPLGADAGHPGGQDVTLSFEVSGVEGAAGVHARSDDTPAAAHDLGDLSGGGPAQTAGAIGYDPTDPVPFDPSDVDLYHVRISGPGRYAFEAEVFAHRIGSPLNPGVSLFVRDPGSGELRLLAGNDDTMNPVKAADNRSEPLFSDSALFAGLEAGDYYLAVSAHGNVPDPARGWVPGSDGIFDPQVAHSGTAGRTTGPYVLNLRAVPDNVAPEVVAASPGPGHQLAGPPTELTVTFSKPVDLQALAFQAYEKTQQGSLTSVYIRGAAGVDYPRLQSYDPATGKATFLMLDRLAPGSYRLHLSGPAGLADFAGNALAGNTPEGDYVVPFSVTGDDGGGPTPGGNPEDLGVLFPHELEGKGVAVTWPATRTPGADAFSFQVLQSQSYFFLFNGPNPSTGLDLTLTDAQGHPVAAFVQADGVSLQAYLDPGTYRIELSGAMPTKYTYGLRIVLGGPEENPPPLALGPAPVLGLRLTGNPVSTTPPPRVPVPNGPAGSPAPPARSPEPPKDPSPVVPAFAVPPPSGDDDSAGSTALIRPAADSPAPASTSAPLPAGSNPAPAGTPSGTLPDPASATPAPQPADLSARPGSPLPVARPTVGPLPPPPVVAVPSADIAFPVRTFAPPARAVEPAIPVPAGLLVALGAEPVSGLARTNPGAPPAGLPTGPSSSTSLVVPAAHEARTAEGGGNADSRDARFEDPRRSPSSRWFASAVARLAESVATVTGRLGLFRLRGSPEGQKGDPGPRGGDEVAAAGSEDAGEDVKAEANPAPPAARLAVEWAVMPGLVLFVSVERLLRRSAERACSRKTALKDQP